MWGQVCTTACVNFSGRIIPTRVGTSYSNVTQFVKPWDHPHACGDKDSKRFFRAPTAGSSPRVWGQVHGYIGCNDKGGIIPTRVGTRSLWIFRNFRTKDHPHACGDKFISFSGIVSSPGSSPRVWGQASQIMCTDEYTRIIPTRVGTSYTAL